MDEQLVETHPRDALLVSRQKNLEIKKVKERKKVLIGARNIYEYELKRFAEKFLASENLPSDPAQREELAKIYASRCKKFTYLYAGLLPLLLAGDILAIRWPGEPWLPLWFIINIILAFPIIGASIILFENKIPFLRARKLLKTASPEELKNLYIPLKKLKSINDNPYVLHEEIT